MPKVRALMTCTNKVADPQGNTTVVLDAAYNTGDAENRAFAEATPSARVSMLISKGKAAADSIEQGGVYYVDIEAAVDVRLREGSHQSGEEFAAMQRLPEGRSLDEIRSDADASREQ